MEHWKSLTTCLKVSGKFLVKWRRLLAGPTIVWLEVLQIHHPLQTLHPGSTVGFILWGCLVGGEGGIVLVETHWLVLIVIVRGKGEGTRRCSLASAYSYSQREGGGYWYEVTCSAFICIVLLWVGVILNVYFVKRLLLRYCHFTV